jgi:hypothetical protein
VPWLPPVQVPVTQLECVGDLKTLLEHVVANEELEGLVRQQLGKKVGGS